MSFASPDIHRSRPQLYRFVVNLALTIAISVAVALAITYLTRLGGNFLENLVFSVCIGISSYFLFLLTRRLIWGTAPLGRTSFFLLLLAGAPVAFAVGHTLAVFILGLPEQSVMASHEKNATGFVVLMVLVNAFVVWFFWNRGQLETIRAAAEEDKARAAAIEKQAAQAQLQLLQAQIEPHMLFNTLANLQGLIAVDPPRAQHMLDQLIRYLRATLSSSRAETTTLSHEFALMEAYLGLMSVRMGARLSYSLQLPEALAAAKVPPMLLQPLIENAIKHGLEPKIDGGSITVEAKQDGTRLTLTVKDTGLGLDAGKDPGMQVGLKNVRERLQVLYGESATVSLASNAPHGAIATLELPVQP